MLPPPPLPPILHPTCKGLLITPPPSTWLHVSALPPVTASSPPSTIPLPPTPPLWSLDSLPRTWEVSTPLLLTSPTTFWLLVSSPSSTYLIWPITYGGPSDFNLDGSAGTDSDIESFFTCLSTPGCPGADFDNDGDVGTDSDISAFFYALSHSTCPPPPPAHP